jgi:hypothetical protein
MFMYKKYLISNSDHFDPEQYTFIAEDLAAMIDQIKIVAPYFKAEIIVSFLKDRCLESEWITANPVLAQLVTSKSVYSSKIESLFDSCKNNPAFGQQLETYLKWKLAPENM